VQRKTVSTKKGEGGGGRRQGLLSVKTPTRKGDHLVARKNPRRELQRASSSIEEKNGQKKRPFQRRSEWKKSYFL